MPEIHNINGTDHEVPRDIEAAGREAIAAWAEKIRTQKPQKAVKASADESKGE